MEKEKQEEVAVVKQEEVLIKVKPEVFDVIERYGVQQVQSVLVAIKHDDVKVCKTEGVAITLGPGMQKCENVEPEAVFVKSEFHRSVDESVTVMDMQRQPFERLRDCMEQFTELTCNGQLMRHNVINISQNDPGKTFQCNHCSKQFSCNGVLTRHVRIHTGEKPYNCDQCEKRFSRKSTLLYHQRIHTGEKPYDCDQCEKRFSRKTILINHQRIHAGEKPYNCDQCEKRFSRKATLTRHRRTHT